MSLRKQTRGNIYREATIGKNNCRRQTQIVDAGHGQIETSILSSEVTPQSGRTQSVDEIYELLRTSGARRQPVAAMYEEHPRLFCPHLLGRSKQGRRNAFCYQFEGTSDSGLKTVAEGVGGWRCIVVESSSESNCGLEYGTRNRDRIGKLASRRLTSTPALSAAKTHNKDNVAIAALTSAPS
jgi:hypothetical protein